MPYYNIFFIILVSTSIVLIFLDLLWYYKYREQKVPLQIFVKHSVFIVVTLGIYIILQLLFFLPFPSAAEMYAMITPTLNISHIPIATHHVATLLILLIVTFYFAGLIDYTIHRFFSHTKTWWWTHEYHHVPKIVSVGMPGIAARPFSFFITIPTLTLALIFYTMFFTLLKLPSEFFGFVTFVLFANVLILITSHSYFLRHIYAVHHGLKMFAITTPQEHILHHGATLEGNFGNMTTLWDRIFGTYLDPMKYDLNKLTIGVNYNQDFLGAVTFNRVHLPKKWRSYFSGEEFFNTDFIKTDV